MILKESTVRDWKKAYLAELSKKRLSVCSGKDLVIDKLPAKQRGRPPLLGEKLDNELQIIIKAMRARGTPISSSILIGVGRGILLKSNRSLLEEYGGQIILKKEWARSVMRRMGYTKRRANSKSKVMVDDFEEIKTQFLLDVRACIEFEEIPMDMVINWDQTGMKIVPATSWTMEKRGTKRVEIVGIDDKRQITAVFGCTLAGDFLPVQLIYTGKTKKSLPKFNFPSSWHITCTQNHWANEQTMEEYLNHIIIPYIQDKRKEHKLPDDYPALVLYDVFKGQCTANVSSILQANNILYVLIPPNCTDRLQPLDLSINKPAKDFVKQKFQEWYSQEICKQLNDGSNEPVDMRLSIMKPIGAQWLLEMYEYFKSHPNLIINGFRAAGILPKK